ncbi:hypothetical protein K502DRAFT_331653 [Neoconidiobolus thromboides FSU 785]|nr:hypothetical protein K502DRAFT_331653 [Neoconidiobolus thromboides FSU 785]
MIKILLLIFVSSSSYVLGQNYKFNCPKATDKCFSSGVSYLPTDKNAPQCWFNNKGKWMCTRKGYDGTCGKSSLYNDISRCKYDPVIPPTKKCPPKNAKCYDKYGRPYSVTGYSVPKCWTSSNYGWKCRNPSYGSCTSSEVDIRKCTFY